jgi:hypothetical protein
MMYLESNRAFIIIAGVGNDDESDDLDVLEWPGQYADVFFCGITGIYA